MNTLIAVLLEDGESADDIQSGATGATAAPAAAAAEAAPAAVEAPASAPAAAPAPAAPAAADGSRIFASPLARRIAAQKGLDLSAIKGSGPKGRIIKVDVENATAAPKEAPKAAAAAPAAAAAAPSGPSADMVAKMYEGRDFEEVSLDGMRKTIAARLSEAKQTIPHFYLRRDIKLDALLKFRSQLNKQLEGRGVKLSVNDFIIKAVALALQSVPDANAVWAGDRVLKMKASDVAVAVAIGGRSVHTGSAGCGHEVALQPLDRDERSGQTRPRPQACTA